MIRSTPSSGSHGMDQRIAVENAKTRVRQDGAYDILINATNSKIYDPHSGCPDLITALRQDGAGARRRAARSLPAAPPLYQLGWR